MTITNQTLISAGRQDLEVVDTSFMGLHRVLVDEATGCDYSADPGDYAYLLKDKQTGLYAAISWECAYHPEFDLREVDATERLIA